MLTYLIAECPYCPHVWRVKNTDENGNLFPGLELPEACPICKKRFKAPWSTKELKTYKKSFKNYRELRVFIGKRKRERK